LPGPPALAFGIEQQAAVPRRLALVLAPVLALARLKRHLLPAQCGPLSPVAVLPLLPQPSERVASVKQQATVQR
jgi:hypothetical protein